MELGWGLTKFIPPILYGVSFIVIFLTLFKRIDIGIYFLVFFLPLPNLLDWASKYPVGKDINDILLCALIIKWYIDSRKNKETFFLKTPINFPLLVLFFWLVIEFWHGANYLGLPISFSLHDSRLMALKNFLVMPLIYFIIVNNIKSQEQMKVIIVIMIFSILLLDRNFINVTRDFDFSHYSEDLRVMGVASALSGNTLAVFFAQYCIVLVALIWSIKNLWVKFFISIPTLISYYCVMFLFSRSGYLATIVSWLFFGIVKDRKVLTAIILIFITWQVLLPVAVKERIEMTKSEDGFDATSQQRFAMWEIGLDIVAINPIFGAGYDFTQQFNIQLSQYDYTWHSFHNSFLQQAVETGLVGLGIYLWLFFLSIKMGWHLFRRSDDEFQKGIGLGLVGCVLSCMAGNVAGSYWNYNNVMGLFWVLFAIVVRCNLNLDKKDKNGLLEMTDFSNMERQHKLIKAPHPKKFQVEYL